MRSPLFLSVAMAALAACSGSSSGGTVVVPAPTPTPSPSASPSPRTVAGYTPTAAVEPTTGIRLKVGKCINMGNHLEVADDGGRAIVPADFTIIRSAGFDTVRIPVKWSAHASATAPYTIDAAWMAKVKGIVSSANNAGLNVILNMHHYNELTSNATAHATRFAEMWRQIGAEFASSPTNVWLELLNEPKDRVNDANLLTVLNPALAAIRATNPTRPVIIGGQNTSGVNSLATLELPTDPYVVPTFHTYDPLAFTHQGADWITPTPPLGRTFGNTTDMNQLKNNLQRVNDYIARTGRVPFLGEYGVFDHASIPLAERVNYMAIITAAYSSIGVQSCAWAYTNTFKMRQGNAWLPGMLDAVQSTTTL